MKTGGRRLVWTLAGIIGVIVCGITVAQAQRIWGGYYGRTPPKFATAESFDGSSLRVTRRSPRSTGRLQSATSSRPRVTAVRPAE